MKTDEKNTLPRLRIAILGNKNVGKSALTVRFLTRRFIGEYRSNTDLLYRQTVTVNNISQEVEIVDVCCETLNSATDHVKQQQTNNQQEIIPEEPLYWADACIVTYSITDRKSLQYAVQVLDKLVQLRNQIGIPVTLVGNKSDLEHLREVDEIEGRTIAVQHNCQFYEVSVADNTTNLYQAFETLILECRVIQQTTQKTRKFSVSKMIGTLIGKTPQSLPQGGTVVVCQKSDLYKSRVLKRRHNLTATASL
ncbi:ras-related and estrogen-regulated growth inhibitor-like protein [Chrysoperla carnea]|uniref:ras-related and estrogen-regulated growth inhibitor-like protein n=1 Tax=Chrysoperla carnea TaxID=189513 RepID=UPI001D0764FB|nr:ras-related and estrogen-regulated growth inhibitor-like protein [Chrysoperla carnea]